MATVSFKSCILFSCKVTVSNRKQIPYCEFLLKSHVTSCSRTERLWIPSLVLCSLRPLCSLTFDLQRDRAQCHHCNVRETASMFRKFPNSETGMHNGCLWKLHRGGSFLSGSDWFWKVWKEKRKGRQHSGDGSSPRHKTASYLISQHDEIPPCVFTVKTWRFKSYQYSKILKAMYMFSFWVHRSSVP